MTFSEILGQDHIKNHLMQSVKQDRIPHAQLFVGPEGSGTLSMAIAYAHFIFFYTAKNDDQKRAVNAMFSKFAHPDLHFFYPTFTTKSVSKNPRSIDFVNEWRSFLAKNPYAGIFDWYQELEVGNKQGEIRVQDASEILKLIALKSYEGGYKIIIVWGADLINIQASNKLLKLIEEPTPNTLLLLITEHEEDVLQTIRSRCQAIHFNGIPEKVMADHLEKTYQIDFKKALNLAHQAQGNLNKALKIYHQNDETFQFEQWFVLWVRAAFKAKGNKEAIIDLLDWSENIAKLGRETQKNFLLFCIEMFRQAMLIQYKAHSLVFLEPTAENFKLEKFAPFVNGANIAEIYHEISEALFHIERNGNGKIILSDLSIKLTRLIHKK
jgi:DNA polymerase-3 subunit delta'